MPSKNFTDEQLTVDKGHLVERTLEDGTVIWRSTVYFGKQGKLKTLYVRNRTEAKKLHRDRIGEIDKGKQPTARLTLGQARDKCWQACQELIDAGDSPIGAAALDNHRRSWRLRISTFQYQGKSVDNLLLEEFKKPVARAFLRHLKTSGKAQGTQYKTLDAMRHTLGFCREDDLMDFDPFSSIKRGEFPSPDTRPGWEGKVFTKEEIDSICEAALSEQFRIESMKATKRAPALLGEAVIAYAKGGFRLSELAGQRWSAIDGKFVWVREQRRRQKSVETAATKGPKSKQGLRRVPRVPDLVASHDRQRAHERSKGKGCFPEDFIYTDLDGKPVSVWQLQAAVRRACKIAGLGSHGPQVLRRTLGTHLAYKGFESVEGALILGNTAQVFEKSYVKQLRDDKHLEELGKRMAS